MKLIAILFVSLVLTACGVAPARTELPQQQLPLPEQGDSGCEHLSDRPQAYQNCLDILTFKRESEQQQMRQLQQRPATPRRR